MKKLLAAVLVLGLICAALTACKPIQARGDEPAAEETAQTNEAAALEKKYTAGTTTETEWKSDWLGLKFTAGESMLMADDEEISALLDANADISAENGELVYEMMATAPDGSNIVIMSEKLPFSYITEVQFIEIMKQQIEEMNADVSYGELSEKNLCGMEFTGFSYAMTLEGVSLKQDCLIKKKDGRMVSVLISYADPERLDAMLACFSAL